MFAKNEDVGTEQDNDFYCIEKMVRQNKIMSMRNVLQFNNMLNVGQMPIETLSFEVFSSLHEAQSQSHHQNN